MASESHDYGYDLGSFKRNVTTTDPSAQLWFNRGFIWSYAFHHEESAGCFEKAIAHDAKCAMAHWGLAYALGPNYNKPWDLFDEMELKATTKKIVNANARAKDNSDNITDTERALVDAIQKRVPEGTDDLAFRSCNEAYAEAMSLVYQKFPSDLDVAALYADSIMNLSAWDLWDLNTGEPTPGARSLEAKSVLETALRQDGALQHPGLLHLYIHLMEMSKTPDVALEAADQLRTLTPDAGHLVHMPSHLDILVGDYQRAIASNAAACLADEKYLAHHGGTNFYTFYRLHDYHSLIYASMFSAQKAVSLDYVAKMEASLPESLMRVESPPMADWLEHWVATRIHVLVRFGLWSDILALPFPTDRVLYAATTATLHYGRGIALAATGDIGAATKERDLFFAAVDRVPASRIAGDFPNKSCVVLRVGTAMLDGELAYRRGDYDTAFTHLREAIARDDALTYAEPWPWMVPTRHAYGALLLEQGRVKEAKRAYGEDLGFVEGLPRARMHPKNLWALTGYWECLGKLGERDGAEGRQVAGLLEEARKVADVEVKVGCFCAGLGRSE